ncbi:hypothetical protein GZ78_28225 [Endozoicomonas numazuensis]|uniref:Uncharacterized protein n=1 Tax=Endozoicomonas numazuensis TaxID=1137799 RepID=A0A081N101_9GAMM|nr:hypothetical protein GZ78_28225 [Endozoicomonas numazuensis]
MQFGSWLYQPLTEANVLVRGLLRKTGQELHSQTKLRETTSLVNFRPGHFFSASFLTSGQSR